MKQFPINSGGVFNYESIRVGRVRIVYFFAIVICWFSQNLSAAEVLPSSDSQAQAIKRFPEIGVAGSEANKRFLSAVEEARKSRPDIFKSADWPLIIALENESLRTFSLAIKSEDLNNIQKEAVEFKSLDKSMESSVNEIGIKIRTNLLALKRHEGQWATIASSIGKLRKNAQISERFVPFREDDRSHLTRAELYRKQADDLASRFDEKRGLLKDELNQLKEAATRIASIALLREENNPGLVSLVKGRAKNTENTVGNSDAFDVVEFFKDESFRNQSERVNSIVRAENSKALSERKEAIALPLWWNLQLESILLGVQAEHSARGLRYNRNIQEIEREQRSRGLKMLSPPKDASEGDKDKIYGKVSSLAAEGDVSAHAVMLELLCATTKDIILKSSGYDKDLIVKDMVEKTSIILFRSPRLGYCKGLFLIANTFSPVVVRHDDGWDLLKDRIKENTELIEATPTLTALHFYIQGGFLGDWICQLFAIQILVFLDNIFPESSEINKRFATRLEADWKHLSSQ